MVATQEHPNEQDPVKSYNLYTWSELKALAPFLSWTGYRDHLFPKEEFSSFINDNSPLIVQNPAFLGNLSALHLETESQTILHYLIWTFVSKHSEALPKSILNHMDTLTVMAGYRSSERPERFITCVKEVERRMGEMYAKWFLDKTFAGDSKVRAHRLAVDVKNAFYMSFEQQPWLDAQTQTRARQKVRFCSFLPDISFSWML